MYIHLGADIVINSDEVVGIFDLDNTTVRRTTKDFLKNAQQNKNIVENPGIFPKSFIVCKRKNCERIYLSGISSLTLRKRIQEVGII